MQITWCQGTKRQAWLNKNLSNHATHMVPKHHEIVTVGPKIGLVTFYALNSSLNFLGFPVLKNPKNVLVFDRPITRVRQQARNCSHFGDNLQIIQSIRFKGDFVQQHGIYDIQPKIKYAILTKLKQNLGIIIQNLTQFTLYMILNRLCNNTIANQLYNF